MRKVVLYISMSLDGYLADIDGGVSWLSGDGSEPENPGSYEAFIETVDTVVLGYSTYHQIVTELSPDTWVYDGMQSYVLTHKKIDNTENIVFTDEEIENLFTRLKQTEGKDIWICGGSNLVAQCHRLGLIERYTVTVIPTILGEGISLFSHSAKEQKLTLLSTKSYNGIVDLCYEKRTDSQTEKEV